MSTKVPTTTVTPETVPHVQNHTESFARDIISTHPTVGPGVGDEMASTRSMKTTQTPSWNNAAMPLALIIPTFTLPTGGAVEAITTAHIPAPTRIGPTIPAEGSGNVVWSSTTRWLTLCYLLLLVVTIIDERRSI
ncbi:hypothetical protein PCH_Pc24g03080 [Penicillium rubens Wisconsin 54-1255]|uniref:Uncharacterized protein n=1 Tax=Penicillium rubens (strain ATCC 28089 / DSM 1075 / NRRL 1951 / Wisconsin 54-1255) TaxID=500485 RepID=B6HX69_PENRW|nr:hypothetical protein PCH_Pc24g03080 [Penicillium rubens Wisconsin 54-1255]